MALGRAARARVGGEVIFSRGRLAFLVGLLAFVVRLPFLAVARNADLDAVMRFGISRLVIEPGLWVPSEMWLPAHFWVLAIPRALGFTSSFAPRVMTAGASAAAVAFATGVADRLFPRLAAAVIGILLALNPLDIHMSVITVAEPWVLLGVTAGLMAFLAYLEEGGPLPLCAGIAAFGFACGLRLEPWLLLPVLPLVVHWSGPLLGRETPAGAMRRAWHVALGASLVPFAWLVYSAFRWADPLHVLTLNALRVRAHRVYQSTSAVDVLTFWPRVLLLSLGPIAVAAFSGGWRLIRDGGPRLPIVLFGGLLAFYYASNFGQKLITDVRYAVFLVWLAVPGVAGWLGGAARRRHAGLLIASAVLWLGTVLVMAEEWRAAPVLVKAISPLPRWENKARLPDE